jgi:hypothetical protein
MIWDFINSLVAAAAGNIQRIYSVLPQSPVFIPTDVIANIQPWLETIAWFFPVTKSLAFLLLYLGAVIIIVTLQQVQKALQFVSYL